LDERELLPALRIHYRFPRVLCKPQLRGTASCAVKRRPPTLPTRPPHVAPCCPSPLDTRLKPNPKPVLITAPRMSHCVFGSAEQPARHFPAGVVSDGGCRGCWLSVTPLAALAPHLHAPHHRAVIAATSYRSPPHRVPRHAACGAVSQHLFCSWRDTAASSSAPLPPP
jgi:hypothetical protein